MSKLIINPQDGLRNNRRSASMLAYIDIRRERMLARIGEIDITNSLSEKSLSGVVRRVKKSFHEIR